MGAFACRWNRAAIVLFILFIGLGCSEDAKQRTNGTHEAAIGTAVEVGPLQDFCSQCHAPPDPAAHPPQQWRSVVLRMNKHRTAKGYAPMTEQQLDEVVTVLSVTAQEE